MNNNNNNNCWNGLTRFHLNELRIWSDQSWVPNDPAEHPITTRDDKIGSREPFDCCSSNQFIALRVFLAPTIRRIRPRNEL